MVKKFYDKVLIVLELKDLRKKLTFSYYDYTLKVNISVIFEN